MKIRDHCVQREKIPISEEEESSIIKVVQDEVKESESKMKLVTQGDANDNSIAWIGSATAVVVTNVLFLVMEINYTQ